MTPEEVFVWEEVAKGGKQLPFPSTKRQENEAHLC